MKYNKKVLKNGLRIITVPMQENQTVTAMVLVGAGSFNETKDTNGIAHFLEHMCFKGTERRPSSYAISFDFEKIGCEYNAFTSEEYTGYYAKTHYSHLTDALELVSDLYLHPILPESEIEKEKGVILEEINRKNDQPGRLLGEAIDKKMYGDQPAGRNVLGPKENIEKFTKKDILKYRKANYFASNTVVVVSGKFDEASTIKNIEKMFSTLPDGKIKAPPKTKENQKKPELIVHEKKTDQTTMALIFRAFDRYDERKWALRLLATVLGHGMSSRLFRKMRSDLGICYSISASFSSSKDFGAFYVSSGVSHSRVGEAVSGILEEIEKVKEELISDEELQKAKDFRIGSLYLGLEASDDFSDFYGFQEIYNQEILSPKDIEEKTRAVTAEEIRTLARQIFIEKNMNLGIVGPHKKSTHSKFEKLLKLK